MSDISKVRLFDQMVDKLASANAELEAVDVATGAYRERIVYRLVESPLSIIGVRLLPPGDRSDIIAAIFKLSCDHLDVFQGEVGYTSNRIDLQADPQTLFDQATRGVDLEGGLVPVDDKAAMKVLDYMVEDIFPIQPIQEAGLRSAA